MATVNALYPTIIDMAMTEGDKLLVEILTQKNDILQDMPFFPCNDGMGHITKIRTGLPTPTWRALYQGIQPTKGTFTKVRDSVGNLEDLTQVDKFEYELQGAQADTWRMWEDAAHIEGISQQWASTIFYGNVTSSPEKFHGLAPRFNALSGVNTAENVISASGNGSDNTSIWLVGWGQQTCHAIYPANIPTGGIRKQDYGEETLVNSDGSSYRVLRTHYQISTGLTVRDWRAIGRICNIDVSDVRGTADNQKALITNMIKLSERVENPAGGRQYFYCNKTIMTALRLGILEKITNNLTFETVEGRRVMMFDGIEIRRCDAILTTEAAIS